MPQSKLITLGLALSLDIGAGALKLPAPAPCSFNVKSGVAAVLPVIDFLP